MCSKKDYVAIAAAIKAETDEALRVGDRTGYGALVAAASRIAEHFASCSPAFQRERFMQACGAPEVD